MIDNSINEILGYAKAREDTVNAVNENKVLEELVLRQLDRMRANPDYDQRFIALAFTHIQKGFMCANRAIFQPKRVEGDLDAESILSKLVQVV